MGGERKYNVSASHILKKFIFLILFIGLFISCSKKSEFDDLLEIDEEPTFLKIKKEFDFILNDYLVHRDTIRHKDNFVKVLKRHNYSQYKLQDLLNKVKDSFDYKNLKYKTGQPVLFLKDKKMPYRIKHIVYEHNRIDYTIISLVDSVVVINKSKPISFKQRTIAHLIESTLSSTLKKEGIDPKLTQKLAKIYEYSIDFFQIKKGNHFALTVTERFINDTLYDGIETLDACYFEYKNKRHYAFPFKVDTTDTKIDYYDENAKGLKNMFLKAPLDFFRISSKFSPKRFHPVQMVWKPHNGTDYAAPTGTPIKSTASGTVERTGYTTGNGNFAKVKHDKTYATQYLHMSKILVRQGQYVQQGQVIGLVGSTGLATGPHVCYRFWKNGAEVDPFKQKLPNTVPIDGSHKLRYLKEITPLKKQLDSVSLAKGIIYIPPKVEEEKPEPVKEEKKKKKKRR